jgi:hypothetical protein
MMEAVRISETSVYFNEPTRHCIPESCSLHTRRRENLKSHIIKAKQLKRMRWLAKVARMARWETHTASYSGNLKRFNHLEDLGVDGRIILKLI